jgi:CxxC-x17-CxxC domain-containing protein
MIITKIQLAAMERVRIPEEERKDFYLYVDEFQNFATSSFANILSEARKYRLNLVVAHQYIAQIENKDGPKVADAVFGNVGTMIIFRVGADDADFLKKEFEPEFTAQDFVSLPNYHIYLKLMIDGITSRPFSATTLPPIKIDITKGVKAKIIEESRKNFARSREEVEDSINRWSGTLQTGDGDPKYKADCSNCKKSTMVPFEPKEGRPVYCKECMFKIKSGELKPQQGFVASRSAIQEERVSTEPLALLGIEFKATSKINHEQRQDHNTRDAHSSPKHNNFSAGNKKHSGPSPLLKGLLEKIVKGEKGIEEKSGIKVQESVSVPQKPISLSELKKPEPMVNKVNTVQPTKEASEEKKSSLKEALSKISITPVKEEQAPQLSKDVENNEPAKKEEIDNPSWQKPKAKKEVPEDVLRKVLE